ncbi:MAG: hypothetical protein Q4C93_02800 [Clostridia bacterium]|nr:hypothetical protein [Clostridia bacterium]
MRNVKRIAALLLALVMVFALCACSDRGSGKDKDKDDKVEKVEKKTDTDLIVGTWEATVDMGDYLNAEMAGEPGMAAYAEYFDFSGVEATLSCEFDEDGDYVLTISMNKELLEKVFRNAMQKVLEEAAAAEGYTLEELAAEEGMTVEELLDAVMEESFDAENFFGDETERGGYEIKDGKLYTFDRGDELDEDDYFEYKLKGDKLTLVAEYEDGELSDESEAGLYPMDFVRK